MWRMLLDHKWMVVLIFVVGAGVTVPLIWKLIAPQYRATAQINVQPVSQRIVYKTEESGIMPLYQQFLNTQVAKIRSWTVLNNALSGDVLTTSWYKNPPKPFLWSKPLPPYERLQRELKVANQKGTSIINVFFDSEKGKDSQIIVDAVVNQYFALIKRASAVAEGDRIRELRQREADLKSNLKMLTERRSAFLEEYGTASLEDVQTLLTQQRFTLENSISELKRSQNLYEWDLAKLGPAANVSPTKEGTEQEDPSPPVAKSKESPQRYFSDAEWLTRYRDWQQRQADLQLVRNSHRYGDHHPKMVELKGALEIAESRLKEREKELLAQGETGMAANSPNAMVQVVGKTRAQLVYQRDRSAKIQKQLEEELKNLDDRLRKVSAVASQLLLRTQEMDETKRVFDAVSQRLNELDIERSVPDRITLWAPASFSQVAVVDRRWRYAAIAVMGWLALGLGLAFLRGRLDTSMAQMIDVTSNVQIPFLGQLPHLETGVDPLVESPALFAESIRMVRTSLLDRVKDLQRVTVLVTSPGMACGKTTLSLLLARSLGLVGKRVLVVDADLRRLGLTRRLGMGDKQGLVNLMCNGQSGLEVAVRSEELGVDVIPGGQGVTMEDVEGMADGRLARCLDGWRSRYDFILLDAPPVLPVADARIIAGLVDGVIMAVRASQTRRAEAVAALAELSAAGSKLFGTVLVGIHLRASYYRHYRYERLPS